MLVSLILQILLLAKATSAVLCLASLSKCPPVCTTDSTTQCECTDGRSACDMGHESCLNDNLGGCQDIVTSTTTITPTVTRTSTVATVSVATGTGVYTDLSTTTTTSKSTSVITETKTVTATTTGEGETKTVVQTVTVRQKRDLQWSEDISTLLHPELKMLVKRADRLTRYKTVTANPTTRVVPVTATGGYQTTTTSKAVTTSTDTSVSLSTTTTTTTITVNKDGKDVTRTSISTVTGVSTTAAAAGTVTTVGANSPSTTTRSGGSQRHLSDPFVPLAIFGCLVVAM